MTKFNTDVVYKVTKEAKGKDLELGNLYFKNVPVTFAQVLKAGKKFNSEDTAYQLHLFINKDTMDKLEEIGLNKEMAEVGVTKIKKGSNRGNIKYKLDEHNENYKGMFAASFSRDTVKRNKTTGEFIKDIAPLKVVGAEGNPFTEEVGNGSICHVKMFSYKNEEGMLVVMLDTVVVLQHVPYTGKGGDFFDDELGLSVKATDKPEVDPELTQTKSKAPIDPQEPNGFDAFDDDIPF
jgi:hypothetical protein